MEFTRISSKHVIFDNPEYIRDSILFNVIEDSRQSAASNFYSDGKDIIIQNYNESSRVWIWTSSAVKNDTKSLMDLTFFLRDLNIPNIRLYVKYEVANLLSDLYALVSFEVSYSVKDEFSLGLFICENINIDENALKKYKTVKLNQDDEKDKKLITEFYNALSAEFKWNNLKSKLGEYEKHEMYGIIADGKLVSNIVTGRITHENIINIESVSVLKNYRKKGYGYTNIMYVMNEMKKKNYKPVFYSHIGNKSAMALWKKAGFEILDKIYLIKVNQK